MGDVSIKMYDKFGHVLRIESTCNNIGTFRVKRKVEHRDGSSSEQKAPLKKSIYSLYQLFTIMKASNYDTWNSSHPSMTTAAGRKNLQRLPIPLWTRGAPTAGWIFLRSVTFKYWKQSAEASTWLSECRERISASILKISARQPCPESLNGSVSMGSSKGCRALINTSSPPMAKRSLPQDLPLETLCLYQHWHRYFSHAEILPFCVKNHC